MVFNSVPRWILQAAVGALLVLGLHFVVGGPTPAAQQASGCPAGFTCDKGCPPGFTGSPETGCTDVNECSLDNGGCHRLSGCKNTPGARTCGGCPPDYEGTGYVGCFDVNECPAGDCSDRIPTDVETAKPPVVTTSGDVAVAANSSGGGPATFTATAKDAIDGARTVRCLPASGSTFKVGTTTVSCWSFNTRGKIGQATLQVTVTQ